MLETSRRFPLEILTLIVFGLVRIINSTSFKR